MTSRKFFSSIFYSTSLFGHGLYHHHNIVFPRCFNLIALDTTQLPFWKIGSVPLSFQTRHMKKRSGDSGKLTLKPKLVTTPLRSKNRPASHKELRTLYPKQKEIDYFDEIDASRDNYEDLANKVTIYGDKLKGLEANEEFWSETLAFQRFTRAKILERKYFKPPKKPNLLTWAAKEQMRFLHQSDPEEWTVEALAKTYPVGIESAQKIIKSKIRLRQLPAILKHDMYVIRNWEIILTNLRKCKLDSDNIVKDFIENLERINIIENALPLSNLVSPRIKSRAKEGVFSAIVKDELKKQDEENEKLIAKQKQIDTLLLGILSEVKDILTQEAKAKQKSMNNHSRPLPHVSHQSLRALLKPSLLEGPNTNANSSNSHERDSEGDIASESKGHVDAPQRVSLLNQMHEHKVYSYCVDDCVYDENGEFLYRIP